MNTFKTIFAVAAIALSAIACEKNDLSQPEELKEVTANNISGTWQLHEWDGAHMLEDPSLIKDYDLTDFLEFVIDDVDINEIGPITFVEIKKEDE